MIYSPTSQEIEQISALLKLVWHRTFNEFLSDRPAQLLFSYDNIQKWIDNPNVYVGLVKYLGRNIVGIVSAYQEENNIHISHLYIHPDFQNKGLGSKLIESVIIKFPNSKKVTLRVFEKNKCAVTFYTIKGFREISRRDANFGIEKTPSILMEKLLD